MSLQLPFVDSWTRLSNTQRWFVSKNRISVETCLPICFLETAFMSQYIEYCTVYSYAVVSIKSGFDLKWTLYTLRIPEKILLRRGQRVTEYCIMRIFVTFPLHEILLKWSSGRECGDHNASVMQTRCAFTTESEGQALRKRLQQRLSEIKYCGSVYSGFIWLRMVSCDADFWIRPRNLEYLSRRR
jgi:hypothetical protein